MKKVSTLLVAIQLAFWYEKTYLWRMLAPPPVPVSHDEHSTRWIGDRGREVLASHPAQCPELFAELGDQIGGVVRVF